MKVVVDKWIDAGQIEISIKAKTVEQIQKIEKKAVELTSPKAPSTSKNQMSNYVMDAIEPLIVRGDIEQ